MTALTPERCLHCDNLTGRAGQGEDSIYFGNVGPFCEGCHDEIILDAAAEAHRLRRKLESWEQGTVEVCMSCGSEELEQVFEGDPPTYRCETCGVLAPSFKPMTWRDAMGRVQREVDQVPGVYLWDTVREIVEERKRLAEMLRRRIELAGPDGYATEEERAALAGVKP